MRSTEVAAYQSIAAGEHPEPSLATDRLAALGLVEHRPHDGSWVAHDPRAAAQSLMGDALAEFRELVARMHEIPTLAALAVDYDPHRMYGGPASEFLPTRDSMNGRIGDVSAAASTSVLTAQPGAPADRDPRVVALGAQRTIETLGAGAEVRSLYTSAAVGHSQTAAYVGQIISAGAEVRTLSGRFPRMMIVDSRHLFIENHIITGADNDAGWHVTDRGCVAWAETVFGALWDRAARWSGARLITETVTTGRQRQILVELEAGYTKRQAARRLEISERTVTGELSALRRALGMRTLYQVMAWWAASLDRDLP
ncbi:LuxR C-terminal-related transcriptional regulator [Streptomyces sp. NPDC102451]|uniref:LuxR C-terminal-related transcriptional regulator n=1 Tax=Streptomyces sp. NPDC102451 TaxID=3366177 RepID=UPI003829CB64